MQHLASAASSTLSLPLSLSLARTDQDEALDPQAERREQERLQCLCRLLHQNARRAHLVRV